MAGLSSALRPSTVAAYLLERGLIDAAAPVEVRPLGGGVSSVVLDVRTPERRLVVKQPLDRFEVPDEWIVKRERVLVEAAALEVASGIVPVPEVLDVDRERLVITMEGAPAGWVSWKQRLLGGDADERIAERLGSLLRDWHERTRARELLDRFDDPEIFGQQRADPYYRTTMARRPDLADAMAALLDRMLATKTCLVHGDWSPKNVLVGPQPATAARGSREGGWGRGHGSDFSPNVMIIDWEIAHAGDPAFDVAFMTNHLMLKAIHRPERRDAYGRCAAAFWSAYGGVREPAYVLAHTGCLMAARVDGKSPAEYLTEPERERTRSAATALVLDPPASPEAAWSIV